MEKAASEGGVAVAGGGECMAHSNFKEIQNLVGFVTKTMLPAFSKLEVTVEQLMDTVQALESRVEELTEKLETDNGGRTRKKPRFFLCESESEDED
jgi:predicted nuclease with TOPRIM domain